ncbi:hypothetical protein LZ31DRAFT_326174 [Colletotrichum somersetense]|nr:hypothetical protein LZ31DRAFT_326174 [Colletotrichum somersetense]
MVFMVAASIVLFRYSLLVWFSNTPKLIHTNPYSAKWTIAMYDKLSKPVFKDRFDEVAEITASDSAALDQSSFPLYPPFIVWAITCRVLGVDCFDEVCQAFDSRTFLKSDFEKWYALLSVQSTTQTPADTQSEAPVGLAQHKRPPADMHMPKPKRQRISGRPKQVASLPTSSDLALSDAEDGISTWDGNLGHTVSAQDSLGENVTASADTTHTDFSQHIHPTESYGTDSLRIDRGTTGDTVHLANSGVFVPPCGFTQSRSQTGLTMMPLAEGPNLDDGSGVQFPLGNNDSFQTAGAAISLDPGNHWSNPETAEGAMSGTHEADYQIDPSTPSAFTEGPYYLYPSEVLVPTQIPLQSSPATVQNMYGYSHVGCNPCLWPTPARPNGSSRTDHVLGVQRPVRF